MRDTSELDLKRLFLVLLKQSWLIVLASVAGFVAAHSISTHLLTPQYTSYIQIHVNNLPDSPLLGNMHLGIGDINAAQRLVETYIVILEDSYVIDTLSDRLLEEFEEDWLRTYLPLSTRDGRLRVDTGPLRRTMRMSSANQTAVLRIEAETGSPYLSAKICTIMAEISPAILMRIVNAGSVEVIGTAQVSTHPSSPRITQNSVAGAAIGFGFMTVVVLLVHLLDNRVKSEDELRRRFNIPILGEIPDFKSASKGGKVYGRS